VIRSSTPVQGLVLSNIPFTRATQEMLCFFFSLIFFSSWIIAHLAWRVLFYSIFFALYTFLFCSCLRIFKGAAAISVRSAQTARPRSGFFTAYHRPVDPGTALSLFFPAALSQLMFDPPPMVTASNKVSVLAAAVPPRTRISPSAKNPVT